MSVIVIKKQSNEYAIDSIGFPTLLTNDASPDGTYN